MIELYCPQPTHQIETRQDDDGAGQQAEDRHGGVLFGPGAAPGAPPIGAPEPAITSTSSACSGQRAGCMGWGRWLQQQGAQAAGSGNDQPAAAVDGAQPASAGPDTSPRPVFQPFCAEQRVPGLSEGLQSPVDVSTRDSAVHGHGTPPSKSRV